MLFLNIFLYILSKIWGGVVTGGGLLPSAVTILQGQFLQHSTDICMETNRSQRIDSIRFL